MSKRYKNITFYIFLKQSKQKLVKNALRLVNSKKEYNYAKYKIFMFTIEIWLYDTDAHNSSRLTFMFL